MTIASTTNKIIYNGNGSTYVFSVPFYFLANADIIATRVSSAGVETTLALTTDYTLTGATVPAGGSLTMFVAPATGEKLVIRRRPAQVQESQYEENAAFPAKTAERNFDRLTMISQDLQEQVGRAVLVDISSTTLPSDLLAELAADVASAQAAATAAAASVVSLVGTSATAVGIGTGSKSFTTQAGKTFPVGSFVLITSGADPANYMHGQVTAYSGTGLTANIAAFGGTGTHTDWTISVSGARGATGATGAAGSGSGDMLKADNLAGLASAATSRSNLGLGNSSTLDVGTTAGTVCAGDDIRLSTARPIGSIIIMASETPPDGYFECDGSAKSRTTYSALFGVIGVAHGYGDNSTTFNIPDLRGRFPRGWDHGATRDPDKATRTAAATGGVTGDHVGSVQAEDFKAHTHNINTGTGTGGAAPGGTATGPAATTSAGGNETRPINIGLMFCIKY